jgi:hypothetical protein
MNALVRLAAHASRKRAIAIFATRAAMVVLSVFLLAGNVAADTPAAPSLRGRQWHLGQPLPDRHAGPVAQVHGERDFRRRRQWHDFILTATIDAADTSTWLAGLGWQPVDATNLNSFDGNGFDIQNLTINRPATDTVGFFKSTGTCCPTLANIRLIGGQITGHDNVGGLIGSSGRIHDHHEQPFHGRDHRAIPTSADWSGRTAAPSRAAARAAR